MRPIRRRSVANHSGRSRRFCGTGFGRRQPQSYSPRNRRGTIIIIAMVCLVVTTALLGSLLHLALDQRTQMRNETRHEQAVWLAESALDRAASRLSADPNYAGETWNIAAEDLGGRFSAAIKIEVRKPDGAPDRRIIAVEANFPSNAAPSSKHTKEIVFDVQAQPGEPKS